MGRTFAVLGALLMAASPALAQSTRRVAVSFTPTARASIAVWIESADGSRFASVGLTEAVAYRGIGNRPGATQMNSGYRWPYGRREGVLPVWAHRRVRAGGAPFPRIIFASRSMEGSATRTLGEIDNTVDEYYCLRFQQEYTRRDSLDAVSCASVFSSNKGRYVTEDDVAAGYAEPWERLDGTGTMRRLSLFSLYPPRRDYTPCEGCDHPDVASFARDAARVLPEIDAITMATPVPDRPLDVRFEIPRAWPDGEYVAYLEIATEGDYDAYYDPTTYPTPTQPADGWDVDAVEWGYPYRGQPSVVFRVPFTLAPAGGEWRARSPMGYGAIGGEDGAIAPLDETILDDPSGAPGSGADRARIDETGNRVRVSVPRWDVCAQEDRPALCGQPCAALDACGEELICGPSATCVGICDVAMAPGSMEGLVAATPDPDAAEAHRWAHLSFRVPPSARRITRYEMRVGTEPIVDAESFRRALPAVQATEERIELVIPADAAPGSTVEVDFGGLSRETQYWVGLRAIDECDSPGAIGVAGVATTDVQFANVSPCFVATAAYGTPLEPRVRALRRLRDRHLRSSAIGRALVAAYEHIGPLAADAIRGDETLRALARAALTPVVWLAEHADRP